MNKDIYGESKAEKKARRKAYKKAKRKATRPWKGLTILSALLLVILIPVTVVVTMFDNTMAAFVGGSFWTLKNEDPNAIYYSGDFASAEEQVAYGIDLVRRVEAEGAALLTNENHALPLEKGAKISLFSNSSVNLVYGGTGSGNIDASAADTLKVSLEKAGFSVNEALWDFYSSKDMEKYARKTGGTIATASAEASEIPWNLYPDDVKSSFADYSDAAIVTISRVGGEGADLAFEEFNYLALDENEKTMMSEIAALKASGTIKKIILLINSANALQVDFLKNNEYSIDACLWVGDVGISGVNAIGDILCGAVSPSGSLVDTYCYDNFSSPAMANFKPVTYDGDLSLISKNGKSYMIYQEGIYVGYKYYETRYEDAVLGTGNAGDFHYDDVVAFPFGYGLSYTDFAYSDMKVDYQPSDDTYQVSVTVTNVGDTWSGKETVQIYAQSPYTDYDKTNKVEKAAVALVGFGKTGLLAPGASEVVNISVERRDLASYDAYGAGTYILEAGQYYLTAATDAHNAINNVLAAKGQAVDGNAELAQAIAVETTDTTTYAVSKAGVAITNQLSDADINLYDGGSQQVTCLSRSDWEGTFPVNAVKLALTDKLIAGLQEIQYDPADYEAAEMPVLGAKNGLKLVDMIGLDYDDPKWNDLLDQLEVDEMISLIGDSFHWTMPVVSVQAPGTRDENGPQGLTASLLGSGATQLKATAFTSEDVMAATFNTDLMAEIGRVMGNDCVNAGIAILYGPGNNIHRTPYGGRNFEYYSEDGFLSGKMSAAEVEQIEAKGVHVVMKHFALNDCEQDRLGLGVWIGEQAGREIYLKAFQAPFEEGNAGGVTTAYTRWGTIWSGGNKGLMSGILRGEWASKGLSITDNVLVTYVGGVDGILAGVSTFDAMLPYALNQLKDYKNDPVVVTAMKQACHRNLYAIANSVGMNGVGPDTEIIPQTLKLITTCRALTALFGILFVVSLVMWITRRRKFKMNYPGRS